MECVIIPKYFNKDDLLNNRLSVFLDNVIIEDYENKTIFNIEYLRSEYLKDRVNFNNLIIEMNIRGFIFQTEQKSSVFPEVQVELPTCILDTKGLTSLRKDEIKFTSFNLPNFLMTVDSSSFIQINKIALEGFKLYNQSIDLSLLKSEFELFGAQWINIEEVQNEMNLIQGKAEKNKNSLTIIEESKSVISHTKNADKNIPVVDKIDLCKLVSKSELYLLDIYRCNTWLKHLPIEIIIKKNNDHITIDGLKIMGVSYFKDLTDQMLVELMDYNKARYKNLLKLLNIALRKGNIEELLLESFVQIRDPKTELLEVSIDEAFEKSSFLLIKENLKIVGCEKLNDLTYDKLQKFLYLKGMGTKKLLDFFDILFNNIDDNSIDYKDDEAPKYLLEQKENIHREVTSSLNKTYLRNDTDLDINVIELKFLQKVPIYKLIDENGFDLDISITGEDDFKFEIESLMKSTLEELAQQLSKEHTFIPFLESLSNYLLIMEDSLFSYSENIKNKLNEKEKLVIQVRIFEGKTLNETGELLGVTRERARQIQVKGTRKLAVFEDKNVFPTIMFLISTTDNKRIADVSHYFDNNLIIRLKSAENHKKFIFMDELDMLMFEEQYAAIKTKIRNMLSVMKRLISSHELHQIIFETFADDQDLCQAVALRIDNIMKANNYIVENDVYINRSNTTSDKLLYAMSTLNYTEINLNDVEKSRAVWDVYSPLQNNSSASIDWLRNLRGTLERSENFIISEPSTFKIFEMKTVDTDLFNQIKDSILIYLESLPMINFKKVYEDFKEDLMKANIISYMMYFIIKRLYSEKFKAGHANTMNFYRKDVSSTSLSDNFLEIIQNYPEGIHKSELADLLGVELSVIDQNISKVSGIIIDNGIIFENTMSIPDEFIEKVQIKIEKMLLRKKFTTLKLIISELKFDPEVSPLFVELIKYYSAESIVKKIVSEISLFSMSYKIVTLYSEMITIDQIILEHFKTEDTFINKQVIDLILELGYSDQANSTIIKRLLSNDQIIQVNELEYTIAGNLKISEKETQAFVDFITGQLGNKKYLSINFLSGYRFKLPRLNYRVTPDIITYIATKNGFEKLDLPNVQSSFDPMIICRKDSGLSYESLVLEALSNYTGNLHYQNVVEFLEEKELIVPRKQSEKVPFELKEINGLSIDEAGVISIND